MCTLLLSPGLRPWCWRCSPLIIPQNIFFFFETLHYIYIYIIRGRGSYCPRLRASQHVRRENIRKLETKACMRCNGGKLLLG
jgi:hypothetical protein